MVMVRAEERRGRRVLVIDISYKAPDGRRRRYRNVRARTSAREPVAGIEELAKEVHVHRRRVSEAVAQLMREGLIVDEPERVGHGPPKLRLWACRRQTSRGLIVLLPTGARMMSARVIPMTACGGMDESAPSPAALVAAPLQVVPDQRSAATSVVRSRDIGGGQHPPAIYPYPRASSGGLTATVHASEESQS
jgi:hypothetical protein